MIGTRIKQLRKENGLTQSELGSKLGVIKQTISSWENGISNPSNESVAIIASIFNVSTDYLLSNDKKITKHSVPIKTASASDTSLKYWIDKTGYAYDEVADKLGISEKKLLSYLNDEKDIPYKHLITLSEICNVSTDCLLGLSSKSRERDFDNILPFRYNYDIAERIKKLCREQNIDISSSYLENLLSLSDTEIFYLIEYGFVPHVDTITKLAKEFNVSTDYLLCQIDEQEEKVLKSFHLLNADNKDIVVGDIKKYLKEQRYENSVATEDPMRKAAGK